MTAYFDRFTIEITKTQADDMSRPGQDATEAVKFHMTMPKIRRQLNKLTPEALRAELKGYGAWDEDELQDHDQNKMRILWIAAGNIKDELYEKSRR